MEGVIRDGDEEFLVSADRWTGTRDRSWGVRPIPGEEGDYPRPTVIDAKARKELQTLLDHLRPEVQAIAARATRRNLG